MSEQYSAPPARSAQTAPVAGQPTAGASPPVQAEAGRQQAGLQASATAIVDDKPEVAVGAAFAAGFLFAMILRRFAR